MQAKSGKHLLFFQGFLWKMQAKKGRCGALHLKSWKKRLHFVDDVRSWVIWSWRAPILAWKSKLEALLITSPHLLMHEVRRNWALIDALLSFCFGWRRLRAFHQGRKMFFQIHFHFSRCVFAGYLSVSYSQENFWLIRVFLGVHSFGKEFQAHLPRRIFRQFQKRCLKCSLALLLCEAAFALPDDWRMSCQKAIGLWKLAVWMWSQNFSAVFFDVAVRFLQTKEVTLLGGHLTAPSFSLYTSKCVGKSEASQNIQKRTPHIRKRTETDTRISSVIAFISTDCGPRLSRHCCIDNLWSMLNHQVM